MGGGMYAANTVLTEDELRFVKRVTEVMKYQPQCSCTSFCFPCLENRAALREIQSLKSEAQRNGLDFSVKYYGRIIGFVAMDSKSPLRADPPVKLKDVYSSSGWHFSGMPTAEHAEILMNLNQTLQPHCEFCLLNLEHIVFSPPSCGMLCAILSPCRGWLCQTLIGALSKLLAMATAPCWSCCSAHRVAKMKPVAKDKGVIINETSLCGAVYALGAEYSGYPYQLVEVPKNDGMHQPVVLPESTRNDSSMASAGYAMVSTPNNMPPGGYAMASTPNNMPPGGYAMASTPNNMPPGGYAMASTPNNMPPGGSATNSASPGACTEVPTTNSMAR